MFYDIPPDIPPAIVRYAKDHFKKPKEAKKMWFMYLTIWNDKELYITNYSFGNPLLNTRQSSVVLYDCHDAYSPSKAEMHKINKSYIVPKYMTSYAKQEHLCHRDKKAYNQHTLPSDYDIKVEHINREFIPKAVVEYADIHYKDSWYPGTDKRIINYITTWNNYEAYVVYWTSKRYHRRSAPRPLLYNGEKARMPGIHEWLEATSNISDFYRSHGRPYLYNKD